MVTAITSKGKIQTNKGIAVPSRLSAQIPAQTANPRATIHWVPRDLYFNKLLACSGGFGVFLFFIDRSGSAYITSHMTGAVEGGSRFDLQFTGMDITIYHAARF